MHEIEAQISLEPKNPIVEKAAPPKHVVDQYISNALKPLRSNDQSPKLRKTPVPSKTRKLSPYMVVESDSKDISFISFQSSKNVLIVTLLITSLGSSGRF